MDYKSLTEMQQLAVALLTMAFVMGCVFIIIVTILDVAFPDEDDEEDNGNSTNEENKN